VQKWGEGPGAPNARRPTKRSLGNERNQAEKARTAIKKKKKKGPAMQVWLSGFEPNLLGMGKEKKKLKTRGESEKGRENIKAVEFYDTKKNPHWA